MVKIPSLDSIRVSESKFNISWVKYGHFLKLLLTMVKVSNLGLT
jgi:hypothetical protein